MSELVTSIVLAAGAGTRMKSQRAKVLHELGGRSMVAHAIKAVRDAGADAVIAVIGHDRTQVADHIAAFDPSVSFAVQEEQNGTGHAVQVALDSLGLDVAGTILVTYADVPLLEPATLIELLRQHDVSGRAVTILTAELADPAGYGRIVRDVAGDVSAIVEHKDATTPELMIHEVNSGIMALNTAFLRDALKSLDTDNSQGELYLTDVVAIAAAGKAGVGAYVVDDVWQTEGVNDRVQLARLAGELNRRTLDVWMRRGVTVIDPATTWVDIDVRLGTDVTLLPGTQLLGATTIGEAATIGPDTTLRDVVVGAGATVIRTHGSESTIGARALVGPFAYLRPGTSLGDGAKIGTFVETKNATIGDGAKVPHLSYVGDAEIGEGTNIGAGTIFANFDGVSKHRTTVGKHARTGSDNVFVAPVVIGDGAYTAAGSVIRKDVPPGSLARNEAPQRNFADWVGQNRPDTEAARAAQDAEESSD
ncbi:bifunctional UDP-N-acetylglucosamine diphosphorylase/glucosamine-1-phosphate N-acetyltransferase GlmU [soil metagenome]